MVESIIYKKPGYELKSKNLKRQYPPMFGRFFDFKDGRGVNRTKMQGLL